MVGEEQQIGAQIADLLIRHLAAAGLKLHEALESTSDASARERIKSALEELDASLQIIRRAGFGLGSDVPALRPRQTRNNAH